MLVDTHAHLYWDSYKEDLDQVLKRCLQSEVGLIINIGTDLESSKQAVKQSQEIKAPKVYATIGFHPHEGNILDNQEKIKQAILDLEDLYINNKDRVVGIGECGLDYHFQDEFNRSLLSTDELKKIQLYLYKAQVNLTKKLNLPLIIHCREAWGEIFIPELTGTTGVFHNFSGSRENAWEAIELGFYLSFSCVVTYPKNQYLRDLIKDLPLQKIVTETDCPFLPPQKTRGERNESANIFEVIKIISAVKKQDLEKVSGAIFQNSQKLFNLS